MYPYKKGVKSSLLEYDMVMYVESLNTQQKTVKTSKQIQ